MMMVPCLASHALHTWDDWGCPDVRPLLPDPRSQHRPTSVLTAARLGSRPRFLDIGYASFSAASAAPVTSYMLSFAQPIACPMRSAPFAAPCLAPQSTMCHASL